MSKAVRSKVTQKILSSGTSWPMISRFSNFFFLRCFIWSYIGILFSNTGLLNRFGFSILNGVWQALQELLHLQLPFQEGGKTKEV